MRKLERADAVATGTGIAGDSMLIAHGRVHALGNRADMRIAGIVEER